MYALTQIAVVECWTIAISYAVHIINNTILYYIRRLQSLSFLSYINYYRQIMQLQKVRSAFERKGYTPNAYIDRKQFMRVLNSLMTSGSQFHDEVVDQLWQQASGDRLSNQLRINQLCVTIVEAQNILRTRIQENIQQINVLEGEKKRLQTNPNSKQTLRKIQEIDIRLDEIYGQKQSFQQDYKLVTQPFGITLINSTYRTHAISTGGPGQASYYSNPQQIAISMKYGDHVQSEELRNIFYLILGFGFIEIIMIYGKSDFLNLIVLTCLLSIYLMNFFDRAYIRLALALIIVSIVLDTVWIIMYAGPKWSPSSVSNNSIQQVGYMRFIVFFTIALVPIKGGIFFFLFKHRNTEPKDKYCVSLGIMKIFLSANKINPISKSLINTPILVQ